jgi:Uncharacterized protein conserved in bacteria (DUF2252)
VSAAAGEDLTLTTGRLAVRSIQDATGEYEEFLGSQTEVVQADLQYKHEAMVKSAFAFLRATYYRWAERFPIECHDLTGAPVVTAVGDLHIENFGTWRDAEGRLAWGINDFDEASPLPYANDLVRLATSAFLAREDRRLKLSEKKVCAALLEGYTDTMEAGGEPIVFAEKHHRLGELVLETLVRPEEFWSTKVGEDLSPEPVSSPPCQDALLRSLPAGYANVRFHSRRAGLGSLGRPRFVALADWKGGRIAREAKAFVPSAALAAAGLPERPQKFAEQLLGEAIRSIDPFLALSDGWVVRRLAPDAGKIGLAKLRNRGLEEPLIRLMGGEAANVHFATPGAAAAVLHDLGKRGKPSWLREAAGRMVVMTKMDFGDWSSLA